MTRITNFRRKRTYLEAGFGSENATGANSVYVPPRPQAQAQVVAGDADASPESKATKSTSDPGSKQPATGPSQKAQNSVEGGNKEAVADAGEEGGEPPRKKRKRHRSKKGKGTQAAGRNKEGAEGTSVDGEAKTQATSKKLAKPKSKKKNKKEYVSPREQRRLKRIQEILENTTCFACREKGHAARDCPKAKAAGEGEGPEDQESQGGGAKAAVGICYRCGSTKHNLSKCKKPADPENPLPFASCFVCSGKGHLASACPQNKSKGVYPNGGSCKICGDTSHLAKDCNIRRNDMAAKGAIGTGRDAGADEDDFMILTRKSSQVEREEKTEEKFKRLLEISEHAPQSTLGGIPRPSVGVGPRLSKPRTAKKVVVF